MTESLHAITGIVWPLVFTLVGAVAVLLLSVAGGAPKNGDNSGTSLTHLAAVCMVAVVAAALTLVASDAAPAMAASIAADGIAKVFGVVVCLGAVLSVLAAAGYLQEHGLAAGEYLALVMLATLGALVCVCAQNLLVLFLGIELMSIAAYVLAGFRRSVRRSQEAALKYFFYGAFASAVMVFGMALIWGEVGLSQGAASLDYTAIAKAVAPHPQQMKILGFVGCAMVFAGLCFKIAAAPFHMWAPDVYEGAPTPSAGYLAVVVKTAAFSGFVRLSMCLFASGQRDMETATQVIEAVAMASMVTGNILAMRQSQIKRMLAYSSIAHVGYLLVGLTALPRSVQLSQQSVVAVAYYLFGYASATVGAFVVVSAFETKQDRRVDLHIDRLKGAVRRSPALALAMVIFMLALAGIPPTAGFVGKVGLFACSLGAGRVAITLAAAFMSVVGAFYYLRVIGVMFMGAQEAPEDLMRSAWLTLGLWACVGLTLLQGLWPSAVLGPMQEALAGFVG